MSVSGSVSVFVSVSVYYDVCLCLCFYVPSFMVVVRVCGLERAFVRAFAWTYARACARTGVQALYLSMHAGFAFARLLLLRRTDGDPAHTEAAAAAVLAGAGGAAGSSFAGALFTPFWVLLCVTPVLRECLK